MKSEEKVAKKFPASKKVNKKCKKQNVKVPTWTKTDWKDWGDEWSVDEDNFNIKQDENPKWKEIYITTQVTNPHCQELYFETSPGSRDTNYNASESKDN